MSSKDPSTAKAKPMPIGSRRVAPSPPDSNGSLTEHLVNVSHVLKEETLKSGHAVHSVYLDFHKFLNRGNVVDMAVGIVMGTAFTAIVTSLVNDIFLPIVSLASPSSQLSNLYILVRCPQKNGVTTPCNRSTYNTPADAKAAGAITWNWGSFIQNIVNFLLISLIVFFIVKAYAKAFRSDEPVKAPSTKPCAMCTKDIPLKAKRCPECTADVLDDGSGNNSSHGDDRSIERIEMSRAR
ncbi:large-conductance mechanosensitive channel [Fimicolochytrium jonesii]|uniref:large-conductance mechanosensitive channel n=1 Tax=Fimicolochytrium jonesii TaxID=1396493 RepID=UPI0022FEBF40|nr:large-conductance mechanosensitive channel [Fimicolochytrium jonesii]KAI8826800.1 large-conductance mechanosensitive channel [Fimicolochytrium jonesii]